MRLHRSVIDHSASFDNYILTASNIGGKETQDGNKIVAREALATPEYTCRLASGNSTHVIQLDDCRGSSQPSLTQQSHELQLKQRPGRVRQSYASGEGCITKLYDYIKSAKAEPYRTLF